MQSAAVARSWEAGIATLVGVAVAALGPGCTTVKTVDRWTDFAQQGRVSGS